MAEDKVRMSEHKPSSNWWTNALRSVGSSSLSLISDMMPYTSGTIASVGEAAKSVRDNVRKATTAGKGGMRAFENNSLIKSAREGLRNAKEDLKSGNLNNTERKATSGPMAEMGAEMDEAFDDVSFDSFGDEDGGDNYNTQITNNYGGDNAYLADSIAEGFKKSTNASIAAGTAQVNALVASTSNSMMANQKFFSEISGKIDSLDKNIEAIVTYLNNNVTKYIEASAAFYGQQSSDSKDGEAETDASTIFGGKGLNLAEYKKLIQKQFDESEYGSVFNMGKTFLESGGIGELVKNPLGMLISLAGPKLISPALKKAFASFDSSVSKALPAIAERIAEYGEENDGILGNIARILGVKTKVDGKISRERFENKSIQWDLESKNAITRVIPGYLAEILQTVRGDDSVKRWDNTTMSLRSEKDIARSIYKENEDAIVGAFSNTEIGKNINQYISDLSAKNSEYGAQLDRLTRVFFEEAVAREKRITRADLADSSKFVDELLAGSGLDLSNISTSIVDLLKEELQKAYESGTDGDLNYGRQQARLAGNAKTKEIDKNAEGRYNRDVLNTIGNTEKRFIDLTRASTSDSANASGVSAIAKGRSMDAEKEQTKERKKVFQTIDDIRFLLDRGINVRIIKGGKPFPNKFGASSIDEESKSAKPVAAPADKPGDNTALSVDEAVAAVKKERADAEANPKEPEDLGSKIENGARNALNKGTSWISELIYGGPDAMGRSIEESVKSGLRKAGDFAKEHILNPIANVLLGEKDENDGGKRKGGVLHTLSDSISDYLLGPKKDDGKREGGFLTKVKTTFNNGIDGWAKTIFGDDIKEGETPEQATERRRKQLKGVAAKGAVGVGAGMLGAGMLHGSLLGAAINPAIGGLLGLGGVIAAHSKSFKKVLFGEDEVDEKGEKTGKHIKGLISLRTQDFFKKNGKMILGGAAVGALKSFLIPSSGGILSGIVGGPVAGMLIGAGVGMVKQTQWFQNLMFGHDIKDANGNVTAHVDGLKDKVKKLFSKTGGKNGTGGGGYKLGMTLLSTMGGAGLGGILGVTAGPLIGGLLGAGAGIIANSEKFKTALFGGKDENGKRHGGLFGKLSVGFNVHILTPLKDGFAEIKDRLGLQAKKIGMYMMIAMQPLKDAFEGFKDRIHQSVSRMFRNIESGLNNVLIKPLKGAFKFILKPVQLLGKGILSAGKSAIQAPFKLIAAGTRKLATALDLHNKKSAIRKAVGALRRETVGFLKAGVAEMFRPLTNGINKIKNKIGGAMLDLINDKLGSSFESIGDMLKTGFKKIVMAPFKLIGKLISLPFKLVGGAFKAIGGASRAVTGSVGMLASMGNTKRIEANKSKLSNAERAKEYYQLSSMKPEEMTQEQQTRLSELTGDINNGKLSLNGMKNAAAAQDKINQYKENISAYQANLDVDKDGNPVTRYQAFKDNAANMTLGQQFNAIFRPGRNEANALDVTRTFYDSQAAGEYKTFKELYEKQEQGGADSLTEQEKNTLSVFEKKFGGKGKKALEKAEREAKHASKVTHNIGEEFDYADSLIADDKADIDEKYRKKKLFRRAMRTAEKMSKGDVDKYNAVMAEHGFGPKDKYDHSMDPDVLARDRAKDNRAVNTLLTGFTDTFTDVMENNLDGATEFFHKGITPGSIYTNDVHSVGILQQIYKFLVGAFTGETVSDRDLDKMANPQKYTATTRLGEKYNKAVSTEEGTKAAVHDWAVSQFGEDRANLMLNSGSVDVDMNAVKEHYMKTHEAEAIKELADEDAAAKEAERTASPIRRAQVQFAGMPGADLINGVAPVVAGESAETTEETPGNADEDATVAPVDESSGLKEMGWKKKKRLKGKAKKLAHGDEDKYHSLLREYGLERSDDVENASDAPKSGDKDSAPQQIALDAATVESLSTATATKNDAENDNNARIAEEQEADKEAEAARQDVISSSNEALEKKLEGEKEDAKNATLARIADNSEETSKSVKSHNSVWSSIFSKKGLITAGVIALAPLLINLLNGGLFNKIKDLVGWLGNLVSDVLGNFWESFNSNGGVLGVLQNILKVGERGVKLLKGDVLGAITNDEGDVDNLGASTLRNGTRSIIKTTATNSSAFLSGAKKGMATAAVKNSDEARALVAMGGKSEKEAAKIVKAAASGSDDAAKILKDVGVDKVSDATKGLVKTAENAAKYGDDVVEAAANGAKLAKNGKGGIIQKLVDMTKEAIARLNEWLGDKFGSKIAGKSSFLKKLVTQCSDSFLTKSITESFPKFGKVLAKMGISTGTAFIAELVFVGLGALDGTERTAYMFDCSKDAIDYIMINISTVFSALLATSVGGVFDIVNSIIEAVSGWNPVKCIAQEFYNLLADDEMKASLEESQEEFKENWKSEAYKRYTETTTDVHKKSEEEFLAQSEADIANQSGLTFNEYNNSVNAGLTDQAVKGVVDFGKRTGERFSNRWSDVHDFASGTGAVIGTLADVRGAVADGVDMLGHGASKILSTAGTALQAGTTGIGAAIGGIFGEQGKAAGETLGAAAGAVNASVLEAGGMAVEAVTGTAKGIVDWANIGISGLGDMIAGKKTWDDVMDDYSQFWSDTADGIGDWWNEHTKNFSNMWSKVTDGFSNWWSDVTMSQEERAEKEKKKAEEEAAAAEKAQEDALNAQIDATATLAKTADKRLYNNAMHRRNMTIHTMASGGLVVGDKPILSMLSPGEIVYNPASTQVQQAQELRERDHARRIIHSNALTNDGITPIQVDTNTNTFLLKAIFSAIAGVDATRMTDRGISTIVTDVTRKSNKDSDLTKTEETVEYRGAQDKAARYVTVEESRVLRILDAINGIKSAIAKINPISDLTSSIKSSKTPSQDNESGSGYGRGANLYQQEDPQWSSGKYKGLDIYESGCGPTAAAIAASAYGSNINPAEAAAIVNASGNRESDGGTRPKGIEAVGKVAGVPMREGTPDASSVIDSLNHGNPVIFMGRDGYQSGRGDSVYGDGMHYVVGTGYDPSTGNVEVMDPLKKKPGKHSIRQVLNGAASTIYTGAKRVKSAIKSAGKSGRGPFYKQKSNADDPGVNDNAFSFYDGLTSSVVTDGAPTPNTSAPTSYIGQTTPIDQDLPIQTVWEQSLLATYRDPNITNRFKEYIDENGSEAGKRAYDNIITRGNPNWTAKKLKFMLNEDFAGTEFDDDTKEQISDIKYLDAWTYQFMTDTQSTQATLPYKLTVANLLRYNNIAPLLGRPKLDEYQILTTLADRAVANSMRTSSPYYNSWASYPQSANDALSSDDKYNSALSEAVNLANRIEYDNNHIYIPYIAMPTAITTYPYDRETLWGALQREKIISDSFRLDGGTKISAAELVGDYDILLNMSEKNAAGMATAFANSDDKLGELERIIREALGKVKPSWGSWTIGRNGSSFTTTDPYIVQTVSVTMDDGTTVDVPKIVLFPIFLAVRGILKPADASTMSGLIYGKFKDGSTESFDAFNKFYTNDFFGDRMEQGDSILGYGDHGPVSALDGISLYFYREPFLSYWPRIKEYFDNIDAFIKHKIIISDSEIDKLLAKKKASVRSAISSMIYDENGNVYDSFAGLTGSRSITLGKITTAIEALWKAVFYGSYDGSFQIDSLTKCTDIAIRCCNNKISGVEAACNKWLKHAYEICIVDEQSSTIYEAAETVEEFKTIGNMFQLEVLRNLVAKIGSLTYVPPTDENWCNVDIGKASNAGSIAWAYSKIFSAFASSNNTVSKLFDSTLGGRVTGPSAIKESDVSKIVEDLYAGDVLFYAARDTDDNSPNHVEMYMGDGYMIGHYDGVKGPVIHKVKYNLGRTHKLVAVKRFIKNEENDLHEMTYNISNSKYAIDGEIEATSSSSALSVILGMFGEMANRLTTGVLTGKWDTNLDSYMKGAVGSTYSSNESMLDDTSGNATYYGSSNEQIVGLGDKTETPVNASSTDESDTSNSNAGADSNSAESADSSESGERRGSSYPGRARGRGRGRRTSTNAAISRPFSRHKLKKKIAKQNGGYGRGRGKYGRGNAYVNAGETVKLPKGAGWYRTIMHWNAISRDYDTNQAKLLNQAENYDENGYGKIDDRYVVATTQTFGEAGDYIDVKQSDGTTVNAIIGDIKSWHNPNEPVTKWGHTGGENVLEFIDNGSHATLPEWSDHPEWSNVEVTEITNRGTSPYVGGNGLVAKNGIYSKMSYDQTGHDKTPGSSLISYKVAGGHYEFDDEAKPILTSYRDSMYPGSEAGDYGGSVYETKYTGSSSSSSSQSSSSDSSSSSSGSNGITDAINDVSNSVGASYLSELSSKFSEIGNDLAASVLGTSSGSSTTHSSSGSYSTSSSSVGTSADYSDKGVVSKPSNSSSFKPTSMVSQNSATTADGWFSNNGGISGGSWRNSYYSGHAGLDYPAGEGSGIYTPVSGTVVKQVNGPDVSAEYASQHEGFTHWTGFGMNKYISPSGFGNYTVVQDDKTGLCHIFAHQSVPSSIKVGTHVNRGDYIGSVGTTGMSTGPHLHYQISPPNDNGGVNTQKFMDPNEFDYSQFVSGQGNTPSNKWKRIKPDSSHTLDERAIGGGVDDTSSNKIVKLLETLVDSIETIVTNTGNSVTGLDKVKKAMESIKIENTTNNNVVASPVGAVSTSGSSRSTSTSSSESYARRIARGH